MKRKLFLLFLFLFVRVSYSQQPITIQLTEKDKLPDNEFYDILEAKDGTIWLAADKGLFKYNGKDYINYSNPDKRGLSVFGLCQDDKNRIWCNNISGQFFFVSNNKLELFIDLKDDLNGQLPEFLIQKNFLYVFFEKGVYKINIQTKQKTLLQDNFKDSFYYGFPVKQGETVYFGLLNSIKKIENDKISNEFTCSKNRVLPKNNTFSVYNDCLFFSSLFDDQHHFYLKTKKSESFKEINVPSELLKKPIIRTLFIDDKFWFCTNEGLYIASLKGNIFTIENHYLKEEACSKVIKDSNNNYWITTTNNGIFVMPNIAIQKLETDKSQGLIKNLKRVDNYVFFSTIKGYLGVLNTIDNSVKTFKLPVSEEISALVYEPLKKCLFVSQKNNSFVWNLSNATIQKCNSFTASKDMFYDESGILLIASFDRANSVLNPFQKYSSSNTININTPSFLSNQINYESKKLRMKRAYTCFIDKKTKNKYVGFVDNFICFDRNDKESIISFRNKPIFAIDIVQTDDQTIWVSTFEDGIIGIKNNKAFVNLNDKNGLLSNQTGKLKSSGNELWISSDKGIQKYDINTKQFKNISVIDGFDNYEITDLEKVGHKLYISSNKGIFIVDTESCFKQLNKPIIFFTDFTVQDKSLNLGSNYTLDYDKNAIKISFNANGFKSSENINYIYRLKRFDDKWTTLESGIDFVRFSSLPSGDYVFEVKARYLNGLTSEPILMNIIINKPFWQTWWFYVLVSLFVLTVFWLYFKRRFARLESEKTMLLEKAQVDKELIFYQLENLRSQMNPHFIFNALNSIQEYIVTNEKANASVYLVKFSKLIRLYLEHSRESEVPLEEEIKALQFYLELEKDRFEDTLNFTINKEESINLKTTKVPSLFIQPYVENAIKHGLLHKKENRNVSISFTQNTDKTELICVIEDNGVGRQASEQINKNRREHHKSFATSANQKRVELINKTRTKKISVHIEDLYDANQNPSGTKVIINIPF
ncbi:sensor histidine kinase [Flavobacterium terrae]|uniref:Two component regulator propeller n=1 Tax=Flavobacterium terrae TaxID=415425 RepID=A0A1M6AS50_9FLAO|nr:histidine kinase [Flavobacterium terrae]SHI39349.1 Two component regulator propeller [Flavobacterium terrae]